MKKINTVFFWSSSTVIFIVISCLALFRGLWTRNKQAVLFRAMKLWARSSLRVNRITYEVKGLDHIDPNQTYILAANHQSIIDILLLAAVLPISFVFIVKKSLFNVPWFGYIMKKSGFISVDRKNPRKDYQTIMDTARTNPISILIFPEGTRSDDGKLGPFKSGVAKFAELTQFPTLPISIDGTIDVIKKGHYTATPGKCFATIGRPILWEGHKETYLAAVKNSIESNRQAQ